MLGPLQAIDGGRVVSLGGPKQRALLALLLIHRNEVLATDRIVEALWSEETAPGRLRALRVVVAGLRKVLEPNRPARSPPHVLVTKPPGYVLLVPDSDLDAAQFEQLVVRAESELATDPAGAADRLDAALRLRRGRPYEDVAYEGFAQPEIRRLEELELRATEAAIETELRLGRHHAIIGRIEALLCDHPLHEPLWSQLMTALYRSGRQPDALHAYRRACRAFAEIGTAPSVDLEDLEAQILLRDPRLDVAASASASTGNLPAALSSFIGREAEVAHVCDLVRTHRLVTLSGPGGVGKSRLAVEAAGRLTDTFRHGVWMVQLAGVVHGEEVAPAVSSVLQPPGNAEHADVAEGLVGHLANRRLLLLLDNCEHLADVVAELAYTLLARCPNLRILATSRRPLRVEGETVLPTGPMRLEPGPDGDPPDAVRLFLDRAAPVSPALADMEEAQELATQVCRRTAGLPLAIELAAARLRIMSLEELAHRCEDDAAGLSGGPSYPVAHHSAMRTTLDWSYRLLGPAEQALFRRLSVFRGGFTLDTATRFSAGFPEVAGDEVRLIGNLVDASMLTRAEDGRLALLEPVRQYAVTVLDAHDEAATARDAHAAVFSEMFRIPDTALFHPADWVPGILQRFEPVVANISAALAWAFASGDIAAAVELTSVAGPLLQVAHPFAEAQRWLRRGLEATTEPTPARARILAQICFNTAHLEGVDRQNHSSTTSPRSPRRSTTTAGERRPSSGEPISPHSETISQRQRHSMRKPSPVSSLSIIRTSAWPSTTTPRCSEPPAFWTTPTAAPAEWQRPLSDTAVGPPPTWLAFT